MKITDAALAFMLVLIARGNPNYQTSTHPHEQTGFYDSFPIEKPIAIPPAVSTLILQTDDAKFVKSFNLEPEQLMEASEIHLGPNNEIHLFVRGIIPLSAADHGWAWIIRHPYKNPEIVLFADGNGFQFLTTKSHGYRDLAASSAVASGFWVRDTFRFSNGEYKLWKHREGQFHDPACGPHNAP
jgi:hypothetical protein